MAKQKIRIRLKAYDHRVIDQSAHEIVETVKSSGARVAGPIPFPTRVERFTVQRSPKQRRARRPVQRVVHPARLVVAVRERVAEPRVCALVGRQEGPVVHGVLRAQRRARDEDGREGKRRPGQGTHPCHVRSLAYIRQNRRREQAGRDRRGHARVLRPARGGVR